MGMAPGEGKRGDGAEPADAAPDQGRNQWTDRDGARDWSRTSTALRPLDSESSASTNSATRAAAGEYGVRRPEARSGSRYSEAPWLEKGEGEAGGGGAKADANPAAGAGVPLGRRPPSTPGVCCGHSPVGDVRFVRAARFFASWTWVGNPSALSRGCSGRWCARGESSGSGTGTGFSAPTV